MCVDETYSLIMMCSSLDRLFYIKQTQTETFHSLSASQENFHSSAEALLKLQLSDLSDYIIAELAFSKLNPGAQLNYSIIELNSLFQ